MYNLVTENNEVSWIIMYSPFILLLERFNIFLTIRYIVTSELYLWVAVLREISSFSYCNCIQIMVKNFTKRWLSQTVQCGSIVRSPRLTNRTAVMRGKWQQKWLLSETLLLPEFSPLYPRLTFTFEYCPPGTTLQTYRFFQSHFLSSFDW